MGFRDMAEDWDSTLSDSDGEWVAPPLTTTVSQIFPCSACQLVGGRVDGRFGVLPLVGIVGRWRRVRLYSGHIIGCDSHYNVLINGAR